MTILLILLKPTSEKLKKCVMYSEVQFEGEGEPIPLPPPTGMVDDLFQECSLKEIIFVGYHRETCHGMRFSRIKLF